MAHPPRSVDAFLNDVVRGRVSRRALLRRAAALGLSLPALAALLRERAVAQDLPAPPDAPARPRIYAMQGGLGVDQYAWLENPDDPEVIAYLEAENAYTEAVMAPTAQLQETIYQELLGRIEETDATVDTPWNGYLYYTRTEEGMDYPFVARKQGSAEAPEELLLDLNAIAGDYLELGFWFPSPDNRYLAYELDPTGEEFFTIHVLDMETGQMVDQLANSTAFEWAQDSRTIFYCKQDEATHRTFALYRHTVGDDQATDPLLYQEDDDRYWLYTTTTKDRAFALLYADAFDTSEIRYLPADGSATDLALLAPRSDGVLYRQVEHHGDEFLILTDQEAPNFKLMAAPVADPAPANWREVIPHRDEALFEWMDVFEGHLALYGRQDGFSQIWVRDLASGTMEPLSFEEAVYTVGPTDAFTGGQNWEFATTKLRFVYSSPVTPDSVFELDMATGERTLLKQTEVIGGHDPSRYVSERIFATAPDGTEVPISLVSLREAPAGIAPGPRPLRLDGYGAYGTNSDPIFSILRIALIDRGVTFAIAHVRGGGELGRRWWDEGRLFNKENTFTDFIACAEHLIAEGHTAPDRLLIRGGSAGGLLMGAVANTRPDLFKAVNADVPAVDLLGVLLRSSIGPGNWPEFGDPSDPLAYDYLRSYDPYQNVTVQDYPAMLVSGGLNDTRVPYWSPAKWVAKLRDLKTDDNLLVLRTEMGAGHFGVSGFYDVQRETAFLYAFFLMALGLEEVQPATSPATATPSAAKRPEVAARQPAPAVSLRAGSIGRRASARRALDLM
jgi:oligopeptidase B